MLLLLFWLVEYPHTIYDHVLSRVGTFKLVKSTKIGWEKVEFWENKLNLKLGPICKIEKKNWGLNGKNFKRKGVILQILGGIFEKTFNRGAKV